MLPLTLLALQSQQTRSERKTMCKTSSQHFQTPPKLQNGLQTLYIYIIIYLRVSTLAPVISESRWQVLQTPPLLWGWCASGGLCAERALLRSLGLALLTAQMSSAKKKCEVEGCCLAPSNRSLRTKKELMSYILICYLTWACLITMFSSAKAYHGNIVHFSSDTMLQTQAEPAVLSGLPTLKWQNWAQSITNRAIK